MSIEKVEALNPHFKWNWRKQKRRTKSLAKLLIPNVSYAIGCRSHPGIVVSKNYNPHWGHRDLYSADVEIKSLIDGIVESCSIYHCAPEPITKDFAMELAAYTIKYGNTIASLKYATQSWHDWADEYDNNGKKSLQEHLGLSDEQYQIYITNIYPE